MRDADHLLGLLFRLRRLFMTTSRLAWATGENCMQAGFRADFRRCIIDTAGLCR